MPKVEFLPGRATSWRSFKVVAAAGGRSVCELAAQFRFGCGRPIQSNLAESDCSLTDSSLAGHHHHKLVIYEPFSQRFRAAV